MSAARLVVQLVRAHYGGQDTTFRAAAEALARGSKDLRMKEALFDAMRNSEGRFRSLPQKADRVEPPPVLASDLLTAIDAMSFAELMLDDDLQGRIDELVLELQHGPELAERGLRPRNRLLFYGPPGNGKTSVAGALAREVGVHGYAVSVAEIVSKYMGGTSESLSRVFRSLRPNTLIVFDELDALGGHRGAVDQAAAKEQNSIVNSLLVLMDRHKDGIVVATTNRPDILDPALLRRFEEHIGFPEPNEQQKAALAVRLCAKHGISAPQVNDCRNFDEVTKRCLTQARRAAMREILGLDQGEQEEYGNEKEERVH